MSSASVDFEWWNESYMNTCKISKIMHTIIFMRNAFQWHNQIRKKNIFNKISIVHYRFETGPLLKFNHEFRKFWKKHFCYQESSLNNVRVILGTRTNQSLERLLVKKKPAKELLTKMDATIQATTTTTQTS